MLATYAIDRIQITYWETLVERVPLDGCMASIHGPRLQAGNCGTWLARRVTCWAYVYDNVGIRVSSNGKTPASNLVQASFPATSFVNAPRAILRRRHAYHELVPY